MARTNKTSKKPSVKPSTKAPAKKISSTVKPAVPGVGKDFQEVRTLIDLLKKNDLAVLEFEQGDFRITLKTPAGASGGTTLVQGQAATPAPVALPAAETPAAAEPSKSNYKEITSPMVGTFYSSPSPDAPAFVDAGKTITADTVVCIIEAMKVMNEIKAEIAGKVVEVVAENGKPVQFGQVLFRVS
jgi:acetyl-CoA carboxylase biotin carboxyl carrier protein